jgi:hypothetical protein
MLVEDGHDSVSRRDLLSRCANRGIVKDVAERCIDNWLNSGVLLQDEQNRIRYALVI